MGAEAKVGPQLARWRRRSESTIEVSRYQPLIPYFPRDSNTFSLMHPYVLNPFPYVSAGAFAGGASRPYHGLLRPRRPRCFLCGRPDEQGHGSAKVCAASPQRENVRQVQAPAKPGQRIHATVRNRAAGDIHRQACPPAHLRRTRRPHPSCRGARTIRPFFQRLSTPPPSDTA